jgi:nicotinate-nucleotide adenylyltransferase
MIRTGIFGGSFNPIHKGHLAVAESAINCGLVDETWLMVSPQNPLKVQTQLLPDSFRLKLAKLATKTIPNVTVSDFEFHLSRPSYTIHTLNELKKAYPERNFSLIIGADNWAEFQRWYHYKDILDNYPIVVYPRDGFPINNVDLPNNVTLLETSLYNVSSTKIREAIKAKKSASRWLPEAVEKELSAFLKQHPQIWE